MTPVYKIPVWETITASWQKVKGTKAAVWGACLITFVIWIVFGIVTDKLIGSHTALKTVLDFICRLISFLIEMGLLYIGIQRAFGLPVNFKQAFHAFDFKIGLNVIILYFLEVLILLPFSFLIIFPVGFFLALTSLSDMTIWHLLGLFCFILGLLGIIYFMIKLWLAMAFVLDRNHDPIKAIKSSFKVSRGNFWALLGIFILQLLILIVSAIPLGIGLIWTIPLVFIIYGMTYKRLLANA